MHLSFFQVSAIVNLLILKVILNKCVIEFLKVRDLENQIAEERKTRLKQESRSLAAVSAQPSTLSSLTQKTITKPPLNTSKRPPLNPSKRPPLRGISNCLPPPSKRRPSHASSMDGKENISRMTSMATNSAGLEKPRRRVSIAVRPPAPSTTQVLQPRRRVSMATLRPETTSDITSPLHTSASQSASGSRIQQSLIRNQRKARYSRLFAPMPEMRASVETSPTLMRSSSSKFVGSPIREDSQKARHPTVVALHHKSLVWSPLKLRSLKNSRKSSLLPSRPPSEMQ